MLRKSLFKLAIMFAALVVQSELRAVDFSVSKIFGSNMVLQRGRPVPVWGRAAPGTKVAVSFGGQQVGAVADDKGEWEAVLKPMKADSVGKTLKIAPQISSVKPLAFDDVLVGDVWLISGQSNAELSWGSCFNFKRDVEETGQYPAIRHIKFDRIRSVFPNKYDVRASKWVHPDKKLYQTTTMTAMGYYFARMVNRETGIPIGILDNNWGGCHIETYCSPEGFARVEQIHKDGEFAKLLKEQFDAHLSRARAYAGKTEAQDFEDFALDAIEPQNAFYTFSQFNAMIRPIVKFPIAGCCWYQGCANGPGQPVPRYTRFLEALVYGWRQWWGYDFPVYIVQISSLTPKSVKPEGGDGYAWVREAQLNGHRAIPKTGLVVTIDIGNEKDIHPRNKQDVGERCALWALRDVYGKKNLVVSGPMFREAKTEGGKIRCFFDHVGGGLVVGEKGPDTPGELPKVLKTKSVGGFSVAGVDRKWFFAQAVIEGDTVSVSAPEVKAPVSVRYAFRGNPMGDCNLYNAEGLPASPFRADFGDEE